MRCIEVGQGIVTFLIILLYLSDLKHNFLLAQRFHEYFSAPWLPLYCFLARQWRGGVEFHLGKRFHAVVHAVFTNTCIRMAVSLIMFKEFVNNSSIVYIMLSIIHWAKSHPVSNGILIGFKRPVLMINVL